MEYRANGLKAKSVVVIMTFLALCCVISVCSFF